jgi:hypothetical protein
MRISGGPWEEDCQNSVENWGKRMKTVVAMLAVKMAAILAAQIRIRMMTMKTMTTTMMMMMMMMMMMVTMMVMRVVLAAASSAVKSAAALTVQTTTMMAEASQAGTMKMMAQTVILWPAPALTPCQI